MNSGIMWSLRRPVSDGDFQVGNMELGGAQEKVPMSQSACLSAKGSKDWVGHMKGSLQGVNWKESFLKRKCHGEKQGK